MDVVERDLRELGRVRAPAGFQERVLAAAGLIDSYAELESPVGRAFVAWNRQGVSGLMLAASPEEFEAWFRARLGRPLVRVAAPPARLRRMGFDLRTMTPFERSVLLKTAEIPRGEVRTYSWVAREIGRPAAVRAVGSAVGHNPVPLLIPCHRVIRADGLIGEYGMGGPANKRALLADEGVDPADLERLARQRVRCLGSRTTHIFCLPTCHNARRIRDANRVPFRSEAEALAAGYRPCRDCRPAAVA